MPRTAAGQFETGGEVNVQNQLPVFVAHADEKVVAGEAGVIDQNVDAAEFGFHVFDQLVDGFGIAEVGNEAFNVAAEFFFQFFHSFRAAVG